MAPQGLDPVHPRGDRARPAPWWRGCPSFRWVELSVGGRLAFPTGLYSTAQHGDSCGTGRDIGCLGKRCRSFGCSLLSPLLFVELLSFSSRGAPWC